MKEKTMNREKFLSNLESIAANFYQAKEAPTLEECRRLSSVIELVGLLLAETSFPTPTITDAETLGRIHNRGRRVAV